MPIALAMVTNYEDDEESLAALEAMKYRAKIHMRIVTITFYGLLVLWFTISIVTGDFAVRMANNFIIGYNAALLLWGLLRIRKLVTNVNKGKHFKTNRWLMNWNLVTYIACTTAYSIVLILTYFN